MTDAGWTTRLRALVRNQDGTTAIKYAVVAAGVSEAVAAAIYALGTRISTNFDDNLLSLIGG